MKTILLFLFCFPFAGFSQEIFEVRFETRDTTETPANQTDVFNKIFDRFRVDSITTYADAHSPAVYATAYHNWRKNITPYFELSKSGFRFYYDHQSTFNPHEKTNDEGTFKAFSFHGHFFQGYDLFKIEFIGEHSSYEAELVFQSNGTTTLNFESSDGRNQYITTYYLSSAEY